MHYCVNSSYITKILQNLREKNRQLIDENIELQSWSTFQGTSGERVNY